MNEKPQRVMILTTPQTYRTEAFVTAAEKLDIELIKVVDMPKSLAEQWGMQLGLDFSQIDTAVSQIINYAQKRPLAAIIAVDDAGTHLAAQACHALKLPHNAVQAADAARNKYLMRKLLTKHNIASPAFLQFHLNEPEEIVLIKVDSQIGYPCVLKPLHLNGSRGVIRVNNEAELLAARSRIGHMLQRIHATPSILVESYIPGIEVALEGVLANGRLQPLALFDKPDPLEGPFFEETLYITPSRLPQETQHLIVETAEASAKALGLQTGSVHAELRINDEGAWIVEVNGRSIGGLCSQTLRFDITIKDQQQQLSLEELILRQACGFDITALKREQSASGVMMIPIPNAGILRAVHGVNEAKQLPNIDDITITAPLHNRLVPLPEGESYLGFIFASGTNVTEVEHALRTAHNQLNFEIDEEIPLLS